MLINEGFINQLGNFAKGLIDYKGWKNLKFVKVTSPIFELEGNSFFYINIL